MTADPALIARLESARAYAAAAQPLILRHFSPAGVRFESKADGTPVTIADRDAEELIRTRIERDWPHDGLIGEEHGRREGRSGADYRWVIDPIDGTKSFIHGVPLFGTLIGIQRLVRRGEDPLAVDGWRCAAGVAHFPALNECAWAAVGAGAFHSAHGPSGESAGGEQARACRVSAVSSLAESTISVTSPRSMLDPERASFYRALNQRCKLSRGWSDCYGSILVATGRIEAMIDVPMQLWDVAALTPIIQEAGGSLTGWDGRPTNGSTGGLATNSRVHAELLAVLADSTAGAPR